MLKEALLKKNLGAVFDLFTSHCGVYNVCLHAKQSQEVKDNIIELLGQEMETIAFALIGFSYGEIKENPKVYPWIQKVCLSDAIDEIKLFYDIDEYKKMMFKLYVVKLIWTKA